LCGEKCFDILLKTGIVKLFQNNEIKNLVDYVKGVEVGLDSNSRKNRTGQLMEKIVGLSLKDFCEKNGFELLKQSKAKKIKSEWGIEIKVDKSERNFDFAIFNPKSHILKLFETNFFNGGGSKLKTVCGEFKFLYKELKAQNIDFIWITDGYGWHKSKLPLEEVYNHNEYVFNLNMLKSGILKELSW
jgi:hypothetical protein